MQLPNANLAIISHGKIASYLLNFDHPDGASKAKFFHSLGFSVSQWPVLADALRQLITSASVATAVESSHGRKYIIEGSIETPCGKMANVRTVWIVDAGKDEPRFVTAYPCKSE